MHRKFSFRLWLLACASLACVSLCSGYSLITDDSGIYVVKWQHSPVALKLMLPTTTNLSDGKSLASSVVAATQAWNAQLGTVQLNAQTAAVGSYANGNHINEIVMDSKAAGTDFTAGMLAVTLSFRSANDNEEADIIFNTAYSWDSYRGSLRNGTQDIQRVAIHELGHLLGLNHPDEANQFVTAIMNSHVSSVDALRADDIAGGQKLYGAPSSVPINDLFANAIAINLTTGSVTFNGSNIAAARETGEPKHDGALIGHSVWWKWTAPAAGEVTAATLGSDFDTVVAVYTGTAVNALTPVASNDDADPGIVRTSTLVFHVNSGVTYYFAVDGWGDDTGTDGGYTGTIAFDLKFVPTGTPPVFVTQPASQSVAAGGTVVLTAGVTGATGFQWQHNGVNMSGQTSAVLTLNNIQPTDTGVYVVVATSPTGSASSRGAIVGVRLPSTTKTLGTATEVGTDIHHPNGNMYDQVLLTGSAAAVRADAGQVLRVSYIDLTNDIVQLEFAGAGTVSIILDSATGPAAPVNYNQSNVAYMKGHASIVVADADETTNLSIFSVGRMTAFDPTGAFNPLQAVSTTNDPSKNGSTLFAGKDLTEYDGFADVALVAIATTNGKFGGLRTSNASYLATKGLTGVYAPGVQFVGGANNAGPVFIGEMNASDNAFPVILTGTAPDVRITGGDLSQFNGRAVQVDGMNRIEMTAGTDSHGFIYPARPLRGRLEQNGVDVSTHLVPPN